VKPSVNIIGFSALVSNERRTLFLLEGVESPLRYASYAYRSDCAT